MGCLSDNMLPHFDLNCLNPNQQVNENTKPKSIDYGYSYFIYAGQQKDGLYVYNHQNSRNLLFYFTDIFYCPLCNQLFTPEEVKQLKEKRIKFNRDPVFSYQCKVGSDEVDIFDELENLYNEIQEQKNHWENLHYRYKCKFTNIEIYLKLYTRKYNDKLYIPDIRYEYQNWKNNPDLKEELLEERREKAKKK